LFSLLFSGHQEEKEKESYWNLLLGCTGMDIREKSVKIGKKKVESSQTTIESEAVEHVDTDLMMKKNSLPRLGLRAIKSRPLPEITMESVRPSQMQGIKPDETLTITTSSYGRLLAVDCGKDPAATGIILHRCFEVLSAGEDRTHLLVGATGQTFTDKQKKKLQAAVTAFETWCYETLGAIKLHKEIPITYQNDDGVVVSGIIDLLVETKKGDWIIDHKTHKPDDPDKEFLLYRPRLEAYRQGLGNKVIGVGVHWVVGGLLTCVT
jgi:ATP-dependent exoDNAse (exonuclease V) beta subunit